jgi:hypothetical protein
MRGKAQNFITKFGAVAKAIGFYMLAIGGV